MAQLLKRWHGKTVVVTGASAGVGRAIVREFAAHGANLGLIARGEDGLRGAKQEVEDLGGRAHFVKADVANPSAVELAAEEIERELGPIDVWINNAMVSVAAPFVETTNEEFERVTVVTYLGTVYGTRTALKRMLPRDEGQIIQVGSALAYRSIPLQSAYCGAKHAILGFTESLRCELLHDKSNVSVHMVQLPGVNTPQFDWIRNKLPNKSRPVGRCYQPELIAEAVRYVAESKRPELLLGGPTLKAVIGDKVAPRILDHYLAATVYEQHQRAGIPEDPNRPDNLFEPLPGDYGAHGSFDDEALTHSPQFWLNSKRRGLALISAGVALAAAFMIVQGRRRREELR